MAEVRKHRVLIHTLSFIPDGVSTAYLYGDIAEKLKNEGNEVTVLTSTPHNNPPEDVSMLKKKVWGLYYKSDYKGIKVYHIPQSKPQSFLKRGFQFIKFHLLSFLIGCFLPKYDVILTPSPPLTIGLVTVILAKLKGAKAIYNVQEIYPDIVVYEGIIKNSFFIKLLERLERFIYNNCNKVVTIDKYFEDIIYDRVRDKTKLEIIPNFIDTDLYKPLPRINDFTLQYKLENKFVIGYIGNIGPYQDWTIIVESAIKLRKEPVVFLIVGGGIKKEWLAQQIQENNLENVLLLDYQQRDTIPLINASADIHFIPMTPMSDLYGLPSKLFAIMASGRSVLASSGESSAISRIIMQADCGFRVDLGDSRALTEMVKDLMEEKEKLAAKAKKGREYVDEFYSKEIVTGKYYSLINDLINE